MPPKGKAIARKTAARKGPTTVTLPQKIGDPRDDKSPSRSSSISLPLIQRTGSLNGSAASTSLLESSSVLPPAMVALHSSGNTSFPAIGPSVAKPSSAGASPSMPPPPQAMVNAAFAAPRVPVPPTSGATRRLSKRGRGTVPSGGGRLLAAPPPPQPTESDVLRISHWWANIKMRFRIRNHAPSELARTYVLEQLAQRRQRVQRAKSIVEQFLLRCASKLRQYVSAKRMVMLRSVATVISTFARCRIAQRLVEAMRLQRFRRSGALMIKYWRNSRMYLRREHRVSNEQHRDQIISEESLERREVNRLEKLSFLAIQHEWTASPVAHALLRALVKQRLATGGSADGTSQNSEPAFGCLWGDDLGDVNISVASPFPEGKVSMRRSRKGSHNKTVDFAAFASSSRALMSPTSGDGSRKALRKNSLLVQQLSRNGSISLDAMLGGAKGHRASLGGGKGAPVSGAALSLKSDASHREACAAGLTFFGDNVDHLETVSSSPLLHEYSRRIGAAAASKDRALADARLQLLNQQFLYPLRPSSLTIPAAQPKLCVSETFLGDAWAAWFATTPLSLQPTNPKNVAPALFRRRSMIVRKRVGGEYYDAQRRLSAAVPCHSPSTQGGLPHADTERAGGASTPSGAGSAAWGRFGARRNTQQHLGRSLSNLAAHHLTSYETPDDDARIRGRDMHAQGGNTIIRGAKKTGVPLVADSALFSIDMETERLLVQEHSQRTRLCTQVQRLLVDTHQRFEEQRHAELSDLMVPPSERVHARGVVQQEMFRYGLL